MSTGAVRSSRGSSNYRAALASQVVSEAGPCTASRTLVHAGASSSAATRAGWVARSVRVLWSSRTSSTSAEQTEVAASCLCIHDNASPIPQGVTMSTYRINKVDSIRTVDPHGLENWFGQSRMSNTQSNLGVALKKMIGMFGRLHRVSISLAILLDVTSTMWALEDQIRLEAVPRRSKGNPA